MLESRPSVTMMAVIAWRGATSTILRINAPIRPARSASPTPIMATTMIPTGPKLMKLGTADVQMKRIPSADSKLRTVVVTSSTLWVCALMVECVTLIPIHCRICDSNTARPISSKKRTAGCGTLFPPRSTRSNSFCKIVFGGSLFPLIRPVLSRTNYPGTKEDHQVPSPHVVESGIGAKRLDEILVGSLPLGL
jgi:hypothetical protein